MRWNIDEQGNADGLVRILNTKTGEIRESTQNLYFWRYDKLEDSPDLFVWEEGNFSCDCNRATFFYGNEEWPKDIPLDDDGEPKYSCEGEDFRIQILHPETREVIYQEFQ